MCNVRDVYDRAARGTRGRSKLRDAVRPCFAAKRAAQSASTTVDTEPQSDRAGDPRTTGKSAVEPAFPIFGPLFSQHQGGGLLILLIKMHHFGTPLIRGMGVREFLRDLPIFMGRRSGVHCTSENI